MKCSQQVKGANSLEGRFNSFDSRINHLHLPWELPSATSEQVLSELEPLGACGRAGE